MNEVLFSDGSRSDFASTATMDFSEFLVIQTNASANVMEEDRSGGGSLLTWGDISRTKKTHMIRNNGTLTAHQQYVDEIASPVVLLV